MQHKCNLIIDSCCDLPFEVVDREGVELIRFPYIMSDGEHADDLYQTSSAHDFYQAMRNGEEPTTAQVPVPVFRDAFERAIASGVPTVYLSFSSGLSGSFDAAALVHDQLMAEHPDAELYIVDTCLASVAEALLVYEALRQRDNGMTAQELARWAEEARYFVDAEFMVDDLEALRRGGRIPSSVAYAGSKLDVKPLLTITVDGKLSLAWRAGARRASSSWPSTTTSARPTRGRVAAWSSATPTARRMPPACRRRWARATTASCFWRAASGRSSAVTWDRT